MLRSYFWLTFCVSVWGSNFIFGKILMQYFSPSMVTMLRLLVIVLFLLGLSLFYRREQRKLLKSDWILILLLGVIGIQSLLDRKSTRLNSSHVATSYAVFCL